MRRRTHRGTTPDWRSPDGDERNDPWKQPAVSSSAIYSEQYGSVARRPAEYDSAAGWETPSSAIRERASGRRYDGPAVEEGGERSGTDDGPYRYERSTCASTGAIPLFLIPESV